MLQFAFDALVALLPTSLGQKLKATSLAVVLPSDQTVTVDGSGVTQPVSAASLPLPTGAATQATLSALNAKVTACDTGACVVSSSALPTGAATSAAQTTAQTSLSSIDGKLTSVTVGTCALPSGAATSALQTSGNSSLTSIDGKIPSKGTTTMSGATPVTLATDDNAVKAITPQSAAASLAEITTGANTTAAQFSSLAATHGVVIQAHPTNTISVRIADHGNASSTRGLVLQPGKALFLPVTNANALDYCNESSVASKIEVLAV